MTRPIGEYVADQVAQELTSFLGSRCQVGRRRVPRYELTELDYAICDVCARWPSQLEAHDRGSTATEQQVVAVFQARIDPGCDSRLDALTAMVEEVAHHLALTHITGIGQPLDDLEIDRADERIDGGQFAMAVGAAYRIYRDAS